MLEQSAPALCKPGARVSVTMFAISTRDIWLRGCAAGVRSVCTSGAGRGSVGRGQGWCALRGHLFLSFCSRPPASGPPMSAVD